MIPKWLMLTLCGVFLGFFSGSAPLAGSGKGTINGKVEDARTKRGIPGARAMVSLGLETHTATTDSAGKFTFWNIPEGTGIPVAVEKDGYRTASATVTVTDGRPAELAVTLSNTYLKLLFPNGGHLIAGTDVEIRWEAVGIEKLRIEFSPNNGRAWLTLADEVDARPGVWSWTAPDIPTVNGFIRITGASRPDLTDRNQKPFSVTST